MRAAGYKARLIYWIGGTGVGLFSALIFLGNLPFIKAVWVVTGPPFFLMQLAMGPFGVKLESPVVRAAVSIAVGVVYYLVLFYPAYRFFAGPRAVNGKRIRGMQGLLGVFMLLHLLLATVLWFMVRA